MNEQHAKDLFSAYRDNELDAGLRQQFEQALKDDSALAAEYQNFDTVLTALESTKAEEIIVPFNLHSRIADGLDTVTAPTKTFSLFSWPKLGLGLAAAVAVASIFMMMRPNAGSNASEAGMGPGVTTATPKSEIAWEDNSLNLSFVIPATSKLIVRDGVDGEELTSVPGNNRTLTQSIDNPTSDPKVLEIEWEPNAQRVLVIPGLGAPAPKEGTGSIYDLAKSMSASYRIAVEVKASDLNKEYKWKFDGTDLIGTDMNLLRSLGLAVSQNENGFYLLTD